MKLSLRRFLSGSLAMVMAVAGMTIGMATSAMAETTTWVPNDDGFDSCPAVFGLAANTTLTLALETSRTGAFTEAIFADGTGNVAGKSGLDIRSQDLNGTGDGPYRSIALTPTQTGTMSVYAVRQSSNSAGTLRLYSGTNNGDGTYTRGDIITDNISVPGRNTTGIEAITFTVTANTTYLLYANSSGIALMGMSLTAGELTEYTWTLDTTGLGNVDGSGLSFGSNTTTNSVRNTLSYSGTGYVLKDAYTVITDTTDGVTVDGTNVTVKPTDDWFDVVAPKTYVSVEPTVDGNTTVYNFVQSDDTEKYLISVNDDTKSATTAYAAFGGTGGTDNDCYVILNTEGAKLYDDSATAAAKLVIPYSASEGKVTVSGSVTPTNNIGGKWKLVDLGCVSVSTDNSKNIVITNDNSADYADNAGAATKGQTVTYSVTIDFASKTASGTVTNGATTKEFTNVAFEAGVENMGSIAFTTNNGNSVSSGNDRALTITSVTITAEEAEVSPITKTDSYDKVAVLTDGTNNYVVSVVSSSDVASYDLVSQNVNGAALDSSDTVYKNIEVGGVTYTAEDFGLNAGDYLFASIIANDNATDGATVISNIQSGVQTVLTNN